MFVIFTTPKLILNMITIIYIYILYIYTIIHQNKHHKLYARRTRSISEQECDPITVLVCIILTLLQNTCGVNMTVFSIVVHQLDGHDVSWRRQLIHRF